MRGGSNMNRMIISAPSPVRSKVERGVLVVKQGFGFT